ncbi:hypothetical protein [Arcanobacterium urinimassiliense]|uniref:hypothetical protein n=1 Tax=Arcanobacterium urinimassiliense TaxID=1871014 RepID=UPI0009397551|nr:hypothetical protein [Arcanobacterium urinimassiliense]
MPSISSLQPDQQLALAQIRVELSHIAPEIPEVEILPDSELEKDLCLDLPSRWVLATALERLCKVQLKDADISQAGTVADLMKLIIQDSPTFPDSAVVSPSSTGGSANSGAGNTKSTAKNTATAAAISATLSPDTKISAADSSPNSPATEADALAAATAELANFFNS